MIASWYYPAAEIFDVVYLGFGFMTETWDGAAHELGVDERSPSRPLISTLLTVAMYL